MQVWSLPYLENSAILRKECEREGREKMSTATSCDTCRNYVYDEDYEYYVCEMDLDEDEMYRFLTSSVQSCPYYQLDNEYLIVRKQM